MSNFKNYVKAGVQSMRPYILDEDMTGISVSEPDSKLPTLAGGMIAINSNDPLDQWYISKDFFDRNYIGAP